MSVLEIVLILMGIIIFIGSFLIPIRKETQKTAEAVDEQLIREMVEREVQEAQNRITGIVDETVTYAMEKTERSMDRLTNEKMMAVNEYSDTVLGEINKNHQEVVFLYDMLNDKHENIKTTATEVEKTAQKVREAVKDAQHSAAPLTAGTPETEVQTAGISAEASVQKKAEAEAQPKTFIRMRPETLAQIQPEAFVQPRPAAEADMQMQLKPETQEAVTHEQQKEEMHAEDVRKKPAGVSAQTSMEEAKPEEINHGGASKGTEVQNRPDVTVSADQDGRNGKRNNNERILELHKNGKSNMAIARELGLGIGEVKLVIDLFEGM